MMKRDWFWTLVFLAAFASAVWFDSCHAGEIAYDLSPPLTSDRDSCGAADVPIDDFDHYLLRLYRCVSDSIVYRLPPLKHLFIPRGDSISFNLPADTDSVRFTVANGIAGWTKVWSVDQAGNRSCGYLSDTWVTQAVAAPPPDTTNTGIWGNYYNGRSRNTFILSRRDDNIDFSWGTASPLPGVNADEFSVQWTGKLIVPVSGLYTLYLEVENGAQLYEGVPGASNIRIDRMGALPLTEWGWSGNLSAGEHGLSIIFQAITGNAEIHFRWMGPNIPKQIVPKSALR